MNSTSAEEKQFLAKLSDMLDLAEKTGKTRFTNFLDPNMLSLGLSKLKSVGRLTYKTFGGYENAERNILCIYQDQDDFLNPNFPIAPIKVTGKDIDKLTHRDYLGTLMSIGIKRETIGDIVISPQQAILFIIDSLAEFVINNIDKVSGVGVRMEIAELTDDLVSEPEFSVKEGTIASKRIDAVIALGFSVPRTKAVEYITSGKVFLNYRLCQSASKEVGERDLITVRGLGRIVFDSVLGVTKKDRIFIRTKRYV